ncbi:MAG: transglycosylase SLT domain-containing protein [Sphingomonadaceae bacterium]
MTFKPVFALTLLITTVSPSFAATESATTVSTERAYAPQLGPNARDRYRDVFASIKAGDWAGAAAKLSAIPEGPLHNVARAELYLAKGSPKVDGAALAALAEKAPDLPQARALVALAKARGIEALPALPSQQDLNWLGSAPRRGKVARADDALSSTMAARILPLIKNNQPNEAEAIVESKESELSSEGRTEWQERVAWSYYITGDDAAARRLAAKAQAGVGDWAAQADWVQGLAAWRQRDYATASDAFAACARRASDSELIAAGHYWAARADMAAGKPQAIAARLKSAARNPETFYGLLALRQLGLKAVPVDPTSDGSAEKLPNVRAALALAEIGERDLADELIRYQARIGDARGHAALAILAGRMDLPATQLFLAHNGPSGAKAPASARYPAPKSWTPTGGWRVDKALVFAHTLEESRFRTDVTSQAGARGLMQVRPGTAADIAHQRGTTVGSLANPAVNIEFGQSYIEQIRDMSETGGFLPKVIAAYNAGPVPVGVWNGRTRDNDDPLLYIESIPYWETRAYVATVMRNYWMYEQQAGEPAKSLAALSQGLWPRFPGLPGPTAVRLDRVSGVASAE